MTAEEIGRALGGHESGGEWSCHCPAHDDENASLSLSEEGGRVLFFCHAGCSQEAVMEALKSRGLWNGNGSGSVRFSNSNGAKKDRVPTQVPIPMEKAKGSFAAFVDDNYTQEHFDALEKTYSYKLADGGRAFVVCRYVKSGEKTFRPVYFGNNDRWHRFQPMENGRPLYHLPEITANPGMPVLVCEGEKCADIQVPGYIVTTWSGGAKTVDRTDWTPLGDRSVTIWPDYDSAGLKAGREILEFLPDAEVLNIEGKAKGWDIADAKEEGVDLLKFIENTPRMGQKQSGKQEQEPQGTAVGLVLYCLVPSGLRGWIVERMEKEGLR